MARAVTAVSGGNRNTMERLAALQQRILGPDGRVAAKWFVLSSLIGLVAGLGAIVFQYASQAVMHGTLGAVAGYFPPEPLGETRLFAETSTEFSAGLLLLVITLGGLASGLIVYTFAPEAEGHGTDAAIEAFHQKRGYIRPIIPLIKLIASALTIGTGGSGGREGPIAQIGAGFGSYLATRLGLSTRDRRIMLAAGMGAGVGSIFRAPLAGALFSAEILYRDADLETEAIIPSAIASIVGFSVFSLSLPREQQFMPLFGNELNYSIHSPAELLPLTLLAIVLVSASVLYIKTFYGMHHLFKKLPVIRHLRPAIGGFLTGLTGLAFYYAAGRHASALGVMGTGYGVLQMAIEQAAQVGAGLLLLIAGIKILTTSLTIGSGGSGGVFGPSMVIGGCLGAAVGLFLHDLSPTLVPQPEIYAIVGMAGFFAGCAHAPISTILMVSEMSGDYRLLLPTMWVSTLCFLLCQRWTLYDKQVASRLESPAHRGDFLVDVLEGIYVKDVPLRQCQMIPEAMSMEEIFRLLPATRQNYFPVVDDQGRLLGMFSTDDVRAYLYNEAIWKLAIARDIMITKLVSLTPEDDLNTALRRFTAINVDELPVLDSHDSTRLLGMLRRKDTIAEYNRRLHDLHEAAQAHA
jgi:CIC family chloride channel protein